MVDPDILKNLVPLNNLTESNLERLAAKLTVEALPQGVVICREGDTDNDAIYLLEGGVEVKSRATTMSNVMQGGTPEASFAIAPSRPRQFTVTTTMAAKIIRVDNSKLDRLVVLDELSTTVTRIKDEDQEQFNGDSGWLDEMLYSEAFSQVPPEKFGPLLLKLQPVSVKSGHIVIKQGDPGDYYYVVKKGRFNISRKEEDGKVRILDELKEGSVFGEESLITGEARNATVIAMTDGVLMRLAKRDFTDLLREPLLRHVNVNEAKKLAAQGARLLDVREPEAFRKGAIKGSINLPLGELRRQLEKLVKDKKYIVCCQTGVQSDVAAFLLNQRGLDAYVLDGGLQAIAGER